MLVTALVGWAAVAAAHPAPFSFLDLRIDGGRVAGTLTVHDLDAAHELGLADARTLLDATTAGRHGAALAELLARRLRLVIDGRPVAVTLSDLTPLPDRQALRFSLAAPVSGRPGRVTVDAALFPYDTLHQTFVNVYEDGALRHQAILDARRSSMDYYAGSWSRRRGGAGARSCRRASTTSRSARTTSSSWSASCSSAASLGRLGLIVTAFTVGHSVTLSLAALGIVTPPASLVEPAIALSVVLVGVDNLLAGREDPTRRRGPPAHRWPASSAWSTASGSRPSCASSGCRQAALGWSLFAFNLGVELGQLALVVAAGDSRWAPCGVNGRRPPRRIAMVGSVVVALAGAFWFVQRVFFPEGIA